MEVLARGPVHEAYAEQVSPDPEPGMIAPEAPPEPIVEEPPDWRPDGDDVAWIPGYWFWDDERETYVWVSGVWRRLPPERRWVPGYWQDIGGGYQWIAGFWAPDTAADVAYVDVPPASLDMGPTSPAPSDDHFWTPGTWSWSPVGTYRWRPGYWQPFRPQWTWVSTRYVWTPRGCVFVPGYWDFSLARRGFLFAPVHFRAPIFRQVGFVHRPSCWIGHDALLLHLFASPRRGHLFFGDFYAPIYRQRHMMPFYDYHARHRGFASLYVYYEHHYRRQGIDYCRRVRDWHGHYAVHADRRPAHTYRRHGVGSVHGGDVPRRPTDSLVRPSRPPRPGTVERIAGYPVVPVASRDRERVSRESRHWDEISRERRRFELPREVAGPPGAGSATERRSRQDKLVLPESPHRRRPGESVIPAPGVPGAEPRRRSDRDARDPARIADTLPVTPRTRQPAEGGAPTRGGAERTPQPRGPRPPLASDRPGRIADTLPVAPRTRQPAEGGAPTRGGAERAPQPRGPRPPLASERPGRIADTLPVTPRTRQPAEGGAPTRGGAERTPQPRGPRPPLASERPGRIAGMSPPASGRPGLTIPDARGRATARPPMTADRPARTPTVRGQTPPTFERSRARPELPMARTPQPKRPDIGAASPRSRGPEAAPRAAREITPPSRGARPSERGVSSRSAAGGVPRAASGAGAPPDRSPFRRGGKGE